MPTADEWKAIEARLRAQLTAAPPTPPEDVPTAEESRREDKGMAWLAEVSAEGWRFDPASGTWRRRNAWATVRGWPRGTGHRLRLRSRERRVPRRRRARRSPARSRRADDPPDPLGRRRPGGGVSP